MHQQHIVSTHRDTTVGLETWLMDTLSKVIAVINTAMKADALQLQNKKNIKDLDEEGSESVFSSKSLSVGVSLSLLFVLDCCHFLAQPLL